MKPYSLVLGKLDKRTMLVATADSFVLKEKVKKANGEERWDTKYYYSEIVYALKGYIKHLLRRPSTAKHLDGSVESLINLIVKLDKKIEKIGNKLDKKFSEQLQDPIEAHLLTPKE